jgi:hypothetical protein
MGRDLAQAWQLVDVHDLRGTLPRFKLAILALVRRYGQGSASLAAQAYRTERSAVGVFGPLTIRPAPLPPPEQVQVAIDWATKSLWGAPQPDTFTTTQTKVLGATEKMVLDVGRHTVIDTTAVDKPARGWARIPRPGACSFCALMATRGAVYKEHTGATNVRGPRNPNAGKAFLGEGQAKFHDHCRCVLVPVFGPYEPSAQIREWDALYASSSKGKHGRDALNAFRRAYEAQQGS